MTLTKGGNVKQLIQLNGGEPSSQYSTAFLQGMVNRMLTSYHKYGHIKDAVDIKMDMVKNLEKRLELYKETGNTEWLMDVANYAMIEYMHPQHPDAHFRATSADESPGRFDHKGRRTYSKHNLDMKGPEDG